MKLAHLILAHAQPEQPDQIGRLIDALQHPNADFYIHIDLKTDLAPFLKLTANPQVHLIMNRIKVSWGAYSVVQATLIGFEEILASGVPYAYINLLSGQDYPIERAETIHRFLESQPPRQFMKFRSVHDDWTEAIPRITRYHLTDFNIPGKFAIERWMNTVLPKRTIPESLVVVGRSQWFTITREAVSYVVSYLKAHPNVRRFFRLTWGADEFVFQTILYNSSHKESMVNNNLRYIDWSEGRKSPKTFTISDLGAIITSKCLFARKFSSNTVPDVMAELDKYALKIS